MKALWIPLAVLGGRGLDQLRDRRAGECGKSISVGLLYLLSVGVILAGHWLFWSHLPQTADHAAAVAVGVALAVAAIYFVALRSLDTMGAFGRSTMLLLLVAMMLVNALLAGHELVLLAFTPQVEEQARRAAARGVGSYADLVGNSLGVPGMRQAVGDLDRALADTRSDRDRLPDTVRQLQRQQAECEARARTLQAQVPADADAPGATEAWRAVRQQRQQCAALRQQAAAALQQHLAEAESRLAELNKARSRKSKALDEADDQQRSTVQRDTPTLTASATTGFARHQALWSAVHADTVPGWAVVGLMFLVLLADGFSFAVKILVHDDAATIDARRDADTDLVHSRLQALLARRQLGLLRRVVRECEPALQTDLHALATTALMPAMAQAQTGRAFETASRSQARAHQHARRSGGVPPASMLGQLSQVARANRQAGPQRVDDRPANGHAA